MSSQAELPSVATVIAPILARVARDRQPLLIALAERMAADRYRAWANEPSVAARSADLRACAEREEEIAARVEGLYPDAAVFQRRLLEDNTDLTALNRELFAGRPLTDQFAIQAAGERLGAATWRAFAEHGKSASTRQVFLDCAELEEASAVVLESLIGAAS
jgi:hypothetical protein